MEISIEIERLQGQKIELARYRDELLGIKRKLLVHKANLNSHWIGEEMREINYVLEDIDRRLQKVCNHIEEIESEISRIIARGMEN